jgi:excinuclease ABC subunit B
MTVRRTEKPVSAPGKPIIRAKPGAGSYEDPADAKREKRGKGKSGKPGA